MAFEVEARDERPVTADDHYDEQIREQCVYVYQFWQELLHLIQIVWMKGRIEEEIPRRLARVDDKS